MDGEPSQNVLSIVLSTYFRFRDVLAYSSKILCTSFSIASSSGRFWSNSVLPVMMSSFSGSPSAVMSSFSVFLLVLMSFVSLF